MRPRPIIVHSLAHARAAAEAATALGLPVTLHSAPGAGAYAGVAWFERLIAATRAEWPSVGVTAVLDCGDAADAVMAALRWLKQPDRTPLALGYSGDRQTAARLDEMASALGITLVGELAPGLDLHRTADPLAASRMWLTKAVPAGMASE
ncbi:MAG TPA: hypothetical protein VGB82_02710 [Alphaproteobacteria bacterium]